MGILNVTPDSFSDGGRFLDLDRAVNHALRMQTEGADIIDVGGESTRPGAAPLSCQEELDRVLPVVCALIKQLTIPISIDTTKSDVARQAIDAGAAIINDVSGGTKDPWMFSTAAQGAAGLVLMHARGNPQTMQRAPRYQNVTEAVYQFLSRQIEKAMGHSIPKSRLVVDPGIGFGKTVTHNLTLLKQIDRLTHLGVPVLVGPSRKSFIGKTLNLPTDERLEGTLAAAAIAIFQGARIIRVHDVAPLRRVIDLSDAIRKGRVPRKGA